MEGGNEGRTSINCRALVIAASCRTWFMTAALGSEEEAPKPRPWLILSILTEVEGVDGGYGEGRGFVFGSKLPKVV